MKMVLPVLPHRKRVESQGRGEAANRLQDDRRMTKLFGKIRGLD